VTGEVVGLCVYAAIGAAIVLIGERSCPPDSPPANAAGVALIWILWPVFLVGVAWEWWSERRARRLR
jgi:hypothetical protein